MPVTLMIWNTQGNAEGFAQTAQQKLDILRNIATHTDPHRCLYGPVDAMLLQEVGSFPFASEREYLESAATHLWSDGVNNWHIVYGPHAGAFNIRCNNVLLTRTRAEQAGEFTGMFNNSGVGRTSPYAHINGFDVANIHATSRCGQPDVTAAMLALKSFNRGHPIIVAGDLNVSNEAGERYVNSGTDRADGYMIIAPNVATHNGGGILDAFAAYDYVSYHTPYVMQTNVSDHHPVFVQFF